MVAMEQEQKRNRRASDEHRPPRKVIGAWVPVSVAERIELRAKELRRSVSSIASETLEREFSDEHASTAA